VIIDSKETEDTGGFKLIYKGGKTPKGSGLGIAFEN